MTREHICRNKRVICMYFYLFIVFGGTAANLYETKKERERGKNNISVKVTKEFT